MISEIARDRALTVLGDWYVQDLIGLSTLERYVEHILRNPQAWTWAHAAAERRGDA